MTVLTMSAAEVSRFDTLKRLDRGEIRPVDAMALLVGNACDAIVTQVGESLEPMLREAIARELAQQLARRDAT